MAPKVEGVSSESGDDSSGGSSSGTSGSRRPVKNTEEYRKRRDRNNQAVKKSRLKTKMKTQQMIDRVTQLSTENEELEENIKILNKELGILKDLFVAHAGNAHGVQLNEAALAKMLCEEPELDEGVSLLMSFSQGSPPRTGTNESLK
ncbi:CCAAT/enhancer-binding protein gamma-like isoform X2 [Homarus americanus]|nr:CCAAT/enhancer-binding protein gamma-like isoform X2 [Homarus americanus]XP_042222673.1 CCAAT/enhancer-binding protein gamma-like isoform X2 [Homarus americanus]